MDATNPSQIIPTIVPNIFIITLHNNTAKRMPSCQIIPSIFIKNGLFFLAFSIAHICGHISVFSYTKCTMLAIIVSIIGSTFSVTLIFLVIFIHQIYLIRNELCEIFTGSFIVFCFHSSNIDIIPLLL